MVFLLIFTLLLGMKSPNAIFQVFTDRIDWQNTVTNWDYVNESWPSNGNLITSSIILPSGRSLSVVPSNSTTSCIGQNAKDYLNLVLMYRDYPRPDIITCNATSYASPVKLVFAIPLSSFGLDIEPTEFGSYEMSAVVNDGINITQFVVSGEELASPTFFGFIPESNDTISSITLISHDSSSFAICKMVEGFDVFDIIYSPSMIPIIIPTILPSSIILSQNQSSESTTVPWWPFFMVAMIIFAIAVCVIFYLYWYTNTAICGKRYKISSDYNHNTNYSSPIKNNNSSSSSFHSNTNSGDNNGDATRDGSPSTRFLLDSSRRDDDDDRLHQSTTNRSPTTMISLAEPYDPNFQNSSIINGSGLIYNQDFRQP